MGSKEIVSVDFCGFKLGDVRIQARLMEFEVENCIVLPVVRFFIVIYIAVN